MIRDTFDIFQDKERGRFGDNESEPSPTKAARSNLVDLRDLFFRRETADAVEVSRGHMAPESFWLPKSQIEFDGKPGNLMTVTLPEWLARKKGLL